MKSLLRIFGLHFLIFAPAFGQTSLPPCQGQSTSTWTNCSGKTFIGDDILEGEWLNGKIHGQGTNRFKNGNYYVGEFKFGHRDGLGTFYHRNTGSNWYGAKYVGEWKDDKQNGKGTYFFPDGRKPQTGIYVNGDYQGTEAEYRKKEADQNRAQKQKEAMACLGYKAARFSCAAAADVNQCIAIRMDASSFEIQAYEWRCL